ncbi:MAG TPA: sugar ABC transporter permease, partial [Pedococcus sp.]|nr:sugar ABC transporter permease [Pedococcus sp.]
MSRNLSVAVDPRNSRSSATAPTRPTGGRGRSARLKNAGWVLFFLLPSAIPLIAFTVVPMVGSVWVSLQKWNLISPATWVGLDNYRHLLTDPTTRTIFWHTLLYVVGYLPLVYIGGLALAMALNRKLAGRSIFRAVYFLPVITSW